MFHVDRRITALGTTMTIREWFYYPTKDSDAKFLYFELIG